MKIIKSFEGFSVKVSDIDYPFIMSCYELYLNDKGYVQCRLKIRSMGLSTGQLHKIIMQPSDGKSIHVDHKNGDHLDNTRENLRVCSHEENMRNRKPVKLDLYKSDVISEYKGVNWHTNIEKWQVHVQKVFRGFFTNEIAAANCYNYWAKKIFGEFSLLNECPFMDKNEWESYRTANKKTSSFRGVSKIKTTGKYIAQIWDGRRNLRIGEYDDEIEAALAYNVKAIELRGNKAKLNIV